MLYPTMTESRVVVDLGGVWDFKLDDGTGFDEQWYAAPLTEATTMPVPASYNDLKEGIDFRDHYGWVFYQRTISVPAALREQRVVLRADAVTHHARIYLNGELVAEHRGGFLPFEVELDGHLGEGENLLTIAVDNVIDYTTLPVGGTNDMLGGLMGGIADTPDQAKKQNHPNFDFFNYCGITRTVRLCTTPRAYIADIALTSDVEGIDAAAGTAAKATVNYQVSTVGDGECTVELLDADGTLVDEATGTSGRLTVTDPTLWRPGAGHLYQVRVRFGEDVYTEPFGIRTVRVDGTRFLINERPFYFKGYGKHEDTFPAGRGINLPMNTRDIAIMGWQGANSFRTSHYPYSEEMMRQCDAEGIVVIDETTAVGINLKFGGGANFGGERIETFDPERGIQTAQAHREVIRDLIARDKNHACVVLWSIANEPDSGAEGAYEYFKPLFDLARELDPAKRPCTLVSVQMNDAPHTDCSARLSDVICLNRYYGWYFGGPDLEVSEQAFRAELAGWAELGKPVVMTEFGADTVAGLHDTTPVMYTEEYQVDYYAMNCRVLDEFDFVVGEQLWNFADFATSQSMLRVQGNKKGVFTRDRKPKLAAHWFRQRWHEIPDFDYKK
ncbi:beta-glucuronidase [Propionibacterium australiense]|uniref:Beta-glucuronidase n=1 Tax=Propionibacterium australiense TaxID=119981 RepID=A0A383S973_9ACTN|nr:beta-glucuronidase [Propionibacterium australiense]RLP09905.1 beta-glucuronidase [Propionibacterium australiense]SYZ33816.1 Glycosyl hydrolase family 2 signature [Propionibacterium australiense]VEH91949.1 Beta-glucuronidase [Propionibacterium australiense]